MTRPLIHAVSITAMVALIAACSPNTSKVKPDVSLAGWPESLKDFSIVWTAKDGIDLTSGPAVPVRAYLESFILGSVTGDEKYHYPGYTDAVDEQFQLGGSPVKDPLVGTMINRLLSVTRNGDTVTAIGCNYTYRVATGHGSDGYDALAVPPGAPEAGVTGFEISVSAPSKPEQTTPQQGPSRTPAEDVFGGYRVTGYDGGYFRADGADPTWEQYASVTARCVADAPDPYESRREITTNYMPRSEFPTLPAAPGWPVKPPS